MKNTKHKNTKETPHEINAEDKCTVQNVKEENKLLEHAIYCI